jgi:hypothetical protein
MDQSVVDSGPRREPEPQPEQWTATTITDVDGSLGWCGRWRVRLVLRITVHRRTMINYATRNQDHLDNATMIK